MAAAGERDPRAVVYTGMKPTESATLADKLILQGVQLELTDAMQEAMREKLSVLLRRNDYIVRITVRVRQDQKLGTERHYSATGQIEIAGPDLVATTEGKDAYEAIDQLVEKLDRQLETRHGKRKDKRNHPHATEIDTQLPKIE
jgi:ribosome hibernation promoting factor